MLFVPNEMNMSGNVYTKIETRRKIKIIMVII